MVMFEELLQMVDKLDNEQLNRLRARIEQRQRKQGFQMDGLLEIIDDFRQGLSQSDLDEMFEAMNQEYIEPLEADE
jgi:predicted pyridoxine 5'-phosphate oxidase superfamily flavin-nucleotide-binding protein